MCIIVSQFINEDVLGLAEMVLKEMVFASYVSGVDN